PHLPPSPTRRSSDLQYIYIHHSRSGGGAPSASDHFVIGNGSGLSDGEVQMGQRWEEQRSAAAPVARTRIDPTCISICIVGDFDRSEEHTSELQSREK